jgi:hypothetical protein
LRSDVEEEEAEEDVEAEAEVVEAVEAGSVTDTMVIMDGEVADGSEALALLSTTAIRTTIPSMPRCILMTSTMLFSMLLSRTTTNSMTMSERIVSRFLF